MNYQRHSNGPKVSINKNYFLIVASAFVALILIGRLFNLQVLQHNHYQAIATQSQHGETEIPAQRGEIIIKDFHSNEEFLLATNTTLHLAYADPALIDDPLYVGNKLAPLLFNLEEQQAADYKGMLDRAKKIPEGTTEEEKAKILHLRTDLELEEDFRKDLIEKIGTTQRKQMILVKDLELAPIQQIRILNLPGIEVIDDDVWAYPPQISNTAATAEKLADHVQISQKTLTQLLKGDNRYVKLKAKLDPNISDQIEELIATDPAFKGIGLQEQPFRFYPEGSLAANILGYTNHTNTGQYGIESSYNADLEGQEGSFQTKKDSIGRQITVGESLLTPAIDGDNVVLTIDRSIQLKVEKILEEKVKAFRADSGQILIMNPQNGAIIAMAHYPTFDPNSYGDVFKKVEVSFTPEELENLVETKDEGVYNYYTNPVTLDKYLVFQETDDDGNKYFTRYENYFGPEVYHNKIVSWPYEPGSVFKPIVMAMAIDDGDVTPKTTYNDDGPIGVDFNVYENKYDYYIKNAEGYKGQVNMSTVIAESLNTGMTFVAKRIGPALFYSYLKRFGFLDRTDIEFDSEGVGKIAYFEDWTESELATHAFGQGLTVTMLQVANAYSALVNGGVLMQPHIVEEIRHDDGTTTITDSLEIRRVISEETSREMIDMLVNATENGVAYKAKIDGHFVGGKTGTSQTYKHGIPLSGEGTTIATFAGFGPINSPKFVVLIKFDRPRTSQWGADTAAPTFHELATYLFDYYNIPPDK